MSFSKLTGMNVDPNFISIAGFSSGSFMAMNMHVAFSSTIKGAGLGAGSLPG